MASTVANALDVDIAEKFYTKIQAGGNVRAGEKEMIMGVCPYLGSMQSCGSIGLRSTVILLDRSML
eukprot:SAG31_NODE_45300_length_259_cov_0.956250_1_plen_66_part_00